LRDDLEPGDLARRFATVQVWFSDLDDFDSRSPAKIIAMNAVGAGRLNPAYLRWLVETVLLFCRYGKKRGESLGWRRYYDTFLKLDAEHDWLKSEAFEFIERLLTPESISRLLYPSVREFYAGFGAEKYLVTRNLERIAYRYSKVLPYSGYFHEVSDKAAVVQRFIDLRPELRFFGSGGDSAEDEDAAELLDFHYRKGRIEKPLCLFRAGFPLSLNRAFNIYVGKNRGGLASLLAAGSGSDPRAY
jgi:hypothetical protein